MTIAPVCIPGPPVCIPATTHMGTTCMRRPRVTAADMRPAPRRRRPHTGGCAKRSALSTAYGGVPYGRRPYAYRRSCTSPICRPTRALSLARRAPIQGGLSPPSSPVFAFFDFLRAWQLGRQMAENACAFFYPARLFTNRDAFDSLSLARVHHCAASFQIASGASRAARTRATNNTTLTMPVQRRWTRHPIFTFGADVQRILRPNPPARYDWEMSREEREERERISREARRWFTCDRGERHRMRETQSSLTANTTHAATP